MPDDRDSVLSELSTVLWRERQLLELLLFKVVEKQLVLTCGQDRWLSRATREVELVVEQVRSAELRREIEVNDLTVRLGVNGASTLRSLIEAVEEPWAEIFTKHREAFLELTSEIAATAESNRELLMRGAAATRQTLDWLAGEPTPGGAYTAAGEASNAPRFHHLLNQAM
jgi:FlgN protein